MLLRFLTSILVFVGVSVSAVAQIATYQLSLKDSTRSVLYGYFPNKVAIVNLPEGAVVKFDGKIITPTRGDYILRPEKKGADTLHICTKDNKEIFSKEYIVVDILDGPYIQLGNIKHEIASVSEILANPSLVFSYPECELKPFVRVVQYSISLFINSDIDTVRMVVGENLTGVPFDEEVLSKIAKMKIGDKIFIED